MEKKYKNIHGLSCSVLILLTIVILFAVNFIYKDNEEKIDIAETSVVTETKPIVKDLFEVGVDKKSEEEAISAIRFLVEAQNRHFIHKANQRSYASSIKDLGYMHNDDDRGSITKKSVWLADIDNNDAVALGKTNTEYLLKIIDLNDSSCEMGYIAIAIPQRKNLAMYALYVDEAQYMWKALSMDIFRIFDLSTIKKINKNLSENLINKDSLDEIFKESSKVQVIKDFKLPETLKKII